MESFGGWDADFLLLSPLFSASLPFSLSLLLPSEQKWVPKYGNFLYFYIYKQPSLQGKPKNWWYHTFFDFFYFVYKLLSGWLLKVEPNRIVNILPATFGTDFVYSAPIFFYAGRCNLKVVTEKMNCQFILHPFTIIRDHKKTSRLYCFLASSWVLSEKKYGMHISIEYMHTRHLCIAICSPNCGQILNVPYFYILYTIIYYSPQI